MLFLKQDKKTHWIAAVLTADLYIVLFVTLLKHIKEET